MPFFSNSSVLRNAEGERHGSPGNGNRSTRKIPPLEGRVASGVSRKPDDGRGDLRSASASVERYCFSVRHLFRRLRRHLPLKGKDLGVELVPFLRPSERAARKIPPLEGRVASGVPRKPDDGRGDLRSPFASVEADCFSVRHLFRRLRRHLPLKGKDLGAELVPFLRPSERTAYRYSTSSVACGDTFPSRGRTWGQTSFRFRVRRNGLRVKIPPLE